MIATSAVPVTRHNSISELPKKTGPCPFCGEGRVCGTGFPNSPRNGCYGPYAFCNKCGWHWVGQPATRRPRKRRGAGGVAETRSKSNVLYELRERYRHKYLPLRTYHVFGSGTWSLKTRFRERGVDEELTLTQAAERGLIAHGPGVDWGHNGFVGLVQVRVRALADNVEYMTIEFADPGPGRRRSRWTPLWTN